MKKKTWKKLNGVIIVLAAVVLGLTIWGIGMLAAQRRAETDEAPVSGNVSNLRVLLVPHMTYQYVEGSPKTNYNPYNQRSYKIPNLVGYNVGCGIVSNAVGRSIVTGSSVNPLDYLSGSRQNGVASNPANQIGPEMHIPVNSSQATSYGTNKQIELKKIYNALNSGKPTRMYKNDNRGNQHFVVICGYYEGTQSDYLDYSNFVCMDPYTGTIVRLTDSWSWDDYPATEMSYRIFK
jgi:hypothetical protein